MPPEQPSERPSGITTPLGARIVGLILALVLGQFLYLRAHETWQNYWLLKDSQKGLATITGEHWSGHNSVDYQYTVNGKEYTSHSARNGDDPKYKDAQPGQESIVYYSASHPWLSQLSMPQTILEGAPVILIVLGLEAFAVITIFKPRSGWAFSFLENEKKPAA